MPATGVPQALRERLGQDATIGLLEFIYGQHEEWSERVLNIAVERFERRLAEEMATFRVAVVREIQEGRVETIRWAFMFWVGQMMAVLALFTFVLRFVGH